jgi:hypothetical protein
LTASIAAQLRLQGLAIRQQAASSTLDIARLEQAFTDVFAAIDELGHFRMRAATSLYGTVMALQGQMQKAQRTSPARHAWRTGRPPQAPAGRLSTDGSPRTSGVGCTS